MITFIVIATAMVLAVVALICVPLLSRRPAAPRSPWSALVVLVVMLVGGAGLYHTFSNWKWTGAAAKAEVSDGSPRSMVATLARRLASNPDDLNGWLLLGHSYSVLQETQLSVRAYERANQLGKGQNVDALLGLAEQLITADDSQLTGRAGDLVEKALKLAPKSPQALFYGAAVAIQRKQLPLARQRFVALLAQNPPANIRPIIQQQIDSIDQALGTTGAGATASAAPAAGAGAASGAAATAGAAQVRITVKLAATVKSGKSDAPLFVFVRDPRAAGPPLAVKRLQAHFPQTVELSSADAMLAGHGMQVGQDVEIVARISNSGGPTARSGDPFGSVAYHVAPTGAVSIIIDRLTP